MPVVCITEKPSVARDIASILGANRRCDGFFEGNGYAVTWTFGHLCCLKEPHDYTPLWKRWSLGALPMLPQRFGIKLIDDKGIEKQFHVIESLIATADEVINCGDAGQEGELIQRWVMQKAGISCPVKRLWISSLTDQSIREGFNSLKPQCDFDNLYFAGMSRAIGDWLLGMNATRLYSLKYGGGKQVLSIGRVQTPTLALIVKRQREIESFVPEDFWELKTQYRGVVFNATAGRFSDPQEADSLLTELRSLPLTITSVSDKKGKEAPPRLFDLTSLQVECNRRWGWTADESLKLIQSLYEKKVTTYPRVDTTYLSDDLYPRIPEILRQMTPYADRTAPILSKPITKSKKVFDNSKVTDHHAITPTGQSPTILVGNERLLYHLIAMRFIAAFYPDCSFLQTTVMAKVGKSEFKAIGKVIETPGWRTLFVGDNTEDQKGDNDERTIMPSFTKGESGPHEPSLQKRTTQSPKPYTEGTLLRAMESAGKTVDDEDLREAMKENGIGRPSTRAAIIETLFKRRYIYRQRKNILATEAGIALIDTINEELLKSAKLTGLWENRLRRIESGSYSAAEFINDLKQQVSRITLDVLSDNSARLISTADCPEPEPEKPKAKAKTAKTTPRKKKSAKAVSNIEDIKCPICGKGHIIKGHTAFGCSEYASGCTLRLSFDQYPPTLSAQDLYDKIKKISK